METSFITNVFNVYYRAFKRHPFTFTVMIVVSSVIYIFFLDKVGVLHLPFLTQPTITVQFEATEIYDLRFEKLASKRVRLTITSKEPVEKVTATIQTPKFVNQIKLVSPQTKADISSFEAPNGRKRFEVLYRSMQPRQELVIV